MVESDSQDPSWVRVDLEVDCLLDGYVFASFRAPVEQHVAAREDSGAGLTHLDDAVCEGFSRTYGKSPSRAGSRWMSYLRDDGRYRRSAEALKCRNEEGGAEEESEGGFG